MTSLKLSLFLIVSCSFATYAREVLSENLYSFTTMASASYSNEVQEIVDKLDVDVNDKHDVISALWRPVEIAAFPDNWTYYIEESVNGAVHRMNILVLSEDDYGIIHGQQYDVKRPIDYKPKQYEFADLTNVELESSTPKPGCEILFTRIERNVYIGTYLDCESKTHLSAPPPYSFTLTCNTIAAFVCSRSSFELYARLSYIFFKKERYALPAQWIEGVNYTDPCSLN
ncbi:hypothetical protein BgiBS90_006676 [Biomphalaria glabrata]|nr:hypothetical protein BgiBS90_006676 [Biomphalaria glabrata]